jgi:hypothetical protein
MPNPLTRARTVRVSSLLDAPPDRVWERVCRPATLRFVAWPVLTFPDLAGREDGWRQGETAHTRLRLLGLVPLGRHRLTLQRLDPVARELETDEGGDLATEWRHLITVGAEPQDRCRYTDVVHVRAGALTVPVTLFAHGFYRWRHLRWRRAVAAAQLAVPVVDDAHGG